MRHAWIQSALDAIDPAGLDYADWLAVGMALHAAGEDVSVWAAWSARDAERYAGERDCYRRWNGFDAGGGVTPGTLWHLARRYGWTPPPGATEPARQRPPLRRVRVEPMPLPPDCAVDTAAWLRTLYDSLDQVQLVEERDGKPLGCGDARMLDAWADRIDAGAAIPQYIRINPVVGDGGRDSDVADHRYLLVEADGQPVEEQWAALSEAATVLPIASIVHSGNRSLHALVLVRAADRSAYDEAADAVYAWLERRGLRVDRACRNPSRLTRVPGARRGSATQRLLLLRPPDRLPALDIDMLRATRWPVTLADMAQNPPRVRRWVLRGVARDATVISIAGRAKAGKSFACLHLAAALSCGGRFFGVETTRMPVLHVDLELHEDTLHDRYQRVLAAHGGDASMIHIMAMRHDQPDLDGLLRDIAIIVPRVQPGVVIVDPVYRLEGLDEIDAQQVSRFLSKLATIAHEHRVALVYTHHHRKGVLQEADAVDRPSGSGVWGRMPDAMIDLTVESDSPRVVRVEWVAREVAPRAPAWARFEDGVFYECDQPRREEEAPRRRRTPIC